MAGPLSMQEALDSTSSTGKEKAGGGGCCLKVPAISLNQSFNKHLLNTYFGLALF